MTNSGDQRNWLVLYRKVVLEPDRRKLQDLIAQAQQAIRQRAHELWYTRPTETTERRDMEAALHFLRVLRALGNRSERVFG